MEPEIIAHRLCKRSHFLNNSLLILHQIRWLPPFTDGRSFPLARLFDCGHQDLLGGDVHLFSNLLVDYVVSRSLHHALSRPSSDLPLQFFCVLFVLLVVVEPDCRRSEMDLLEQFNILINLSRLFPLSHTPIE